MLRNGCVQSAVTRKSKITKRTCLGGPLKDNCFRAVLPSVLSPECPFYLWDKSWFLVDNPIYSEKEPLSEIFRQRLGHRTGVPTPARPRFEIDPSQGLRKTLSADRRNQTHAHCLGSEADG